MISPIRYDVEIQEPLSTPVPIPPSILSRDALVIWMFRIAMNEPIMAASTAIQVVRLARPGSDAVGSDAVREIGCADIEADRLGRDMEHSDTGERGFVGIRRRGDG